MRALWGARSSLGGVRAYAVATPSAPITSAHRIPAERTQRVDNLTRQQRTEAIRLVKENPLEWTPTKLAEHFGVTLPLILAKVPLPTKREIRYFATMTRLRKSYSPDHPMTEKQRRIHSWIMEQNNNLPKHREMKKRWNKTAKNELLCNLDLSFLQAIDKKFAKLSEQSLDALADQRKRRMQG